MTNESPATRLSSRQKKASVLFLMLLTVASANESFDWGLVGRYDWEAIVALTLYGLGGLTFAMLAGLRPGTGATSRV